MSTAIYQNLCHDLRTKGNILQETGKAFIFCRSFHKVIMPLKNEFHTRCKKKSLAAYAMELLVLNRNGFSRNGTWVSTTSLCIEKVTIGRLEYIVQHLHICSVCDAWVWQKTFGCWLPALWWSSKSFPLAGLHTTNWEWWVYHSNAMQCCKIISPNTGSASTQKLKNIQSR